MLHQLLVVQVQAIMDVINLLVVLVRQQNIMHVVDQAGVQLDVHQHNITHVVDQAGVHQDVQLVYVHQV